jgi:hypothetical protein
MGRDQHRGVCGRQRQTQRLGLLDDPHKIGNIKRKRREFFFTFRVEVS